MSDLPLPAPSLQDPAVQANFEAIQRAWRDFTAASRPSVPGTQNMRWLTGYVTATGTIAVAGTGGWTVARTPAGGVAGDFTVTFTTAFATALYIPVLAATGIGDAYFVGSTTTTMRVETRDNAGALADRPFTFHVLGPVA